ncbi:MAG: hypothetical protein FWD22_06415 [Treponema sp.]|nr:hypothetical protein [Treponema sp.]
MEIGAIPHHTFPSVGYAISAGEGRMSLPVSPGMVIYSHLRHVSGTPAPEGTQGVNISKLRILDTMIENLSRMKNQPAEEFGNMDGTDESRINELIEQYHTQIKETQSGIYAPTAPATGLLFNIAV